MTPDLAGKRVLVIGGATGIGAAASRAFAGVGASVYVHHHEGSAEAAELLREIEAAAGDATGGAADLLAPGAPAALVDRAAEALGGLDILVDNAGSMVARRPLAEIDDPYVDAVFDLNCRQLIHACRAAVPHLRAAGGGSIITVSSVSGRNGGSTGSSIYSGAKAFVATFTRALAKELAGDGIRVNSVSPGTIHTRFHDEFSTPEKLEQTRGTIPMQRLGVAQDCAGAFLWLASDAMAGYVTGQVIEVNGGQLMP